MLPLQCIKSFDLRKIQSIMTGAGKTPGDYHTEDFVTDESFINYFFKLNKEDEIFWEKWLAAHPDNGEIVEAAKDMLRNLSLTISDSEYKEEIAKIREAINKENQVSARKMPVMTRFLNQENVSKPRGGTRKKYLKYLVPGLLILGVCAYLFEKHGDIPSDRLTEKYNSSTRPVVFTLSDGTVVTLAAHSVFRYPLDFGNKARKVYLDGEAKFEVSRDEAHPFSVYAGDVIATVLGTVFDVKKQQGDSVVLVELIKGRLKVETSDGPGLSSQSVILNPDERVIYKGRGQKLYKEKWESQHDSPLRVAHLVFHKNSFEEIAAQMKIVFGMNLINQNNKKPWLFTGDFKNTTAIDILESICIVEKLTYEVQGDTVFIK